MSGDDSGTGRDGPDDDGSTDSWVSDSVDDATEDVDVGEEPPADACPGGESTDGGRAGAGEKGPGEKFCAECGAIINEKAEVCPECGVRQPGMGSDEDQRLIAALLAIFLGGFGAHKFYLGDTKVGIVYLCFCWTFIPGIVGIVEGLIYLSKSDEEFRRQYLDD